MLIDVFHIIKQTINTKLITSHRPSEYSRQYHTLTNFIIQRALMSKQLPRNEIPYTLRVSYYFAYITDTHTITNPNQPTTASSFVSNQYPFCCSRALAQKAWVHFNIAWTIPQDFVKFRSLSIGWWNFPVEVKFHTSTAVQLPRILSNIKAIGQPEAQFRGFETSQHLTIRLVMWY